MFQPSYGLEVTLMSVCFQVPGHGAFHREGLVADLTLEGTLTSVGPHVNGQAAFH